MSISNIQIQHTTLSKTNLVNIFIKFLIHNSFDITYFDNSKKETIFKILKTEYLNTNYIFNLNISNLSFAYLPKDPTLRRRQVGSLNRDEIPKNTRFSMSLLLAYCVVNEIPIFIAWNPFKFCMHTKNRSCYVRESELLKVIETNYLETKYNLTNSYLFTIDGFKDFFENYIKNESID